MNLKITTTTEVAAPRGTKVITNDEWITLARKARNGTVSVITFRSEDIHQIDLFIDDNWTDLYPSEIKAISEL